MSIVKAFKIPANPRTASQQANRANHKAVMQSWIDPLTNAEDRAGWARLNNLTKPKQAAPRLLFYLIHRAVYKHGVQFAHLGGFFSDYLYHDFWRMWNKQLIAGSMVSVKYYLGTTQSCNDTTGYASYYAPYNGWYTPIQYWGSAGQTIYSKMTGYSSGGWVVAETGITSMVLT